MLQLPNSLLKKAKCFALAIVVILIYRQSFAQSNPDKTIDSLIGVLRTSAEDTNKVHSLLALGRGYRGSGKLNEAKKTFESALELAQKLNFRWGMATAYFRIANTTGRGLRNFPEAMNNLWAALKIWEEIGDKAEIAGTHHNIGLNYHAQDKHLESIKHLTIARKMYEENGQKGLMADTYNTIGTIHKTLGNYPEALENYFASLRVAIEIGDKRWEAACYTNIGNTYRQLGNLSEALKKHFAALKLYEEIKNRELIPIAYVNIGNIYGDQGNYPEALKNHSVALQRFGENKSKGGVANVYNAMGLVHTRQGNFPEALKNYLASLEIYEELKSKNGISDCCIGMGNACINLNKLPEAKQYLTKALSLATETGSKGLIRDAYEGLWKLDSAMKNYEQALGDYKLYTHYKDSLLNESNNHQIAQMKEKYESEKKDKEILQLTNDKQKLENEKQISAFVIKSKSDSLLLVQSEKEKIRLENERTAAINLYNQQQLAMLAKEKKLNELQLEKNNAELLAQKAETERKQSDYLVQKAATDKKEQQLAVLNKEKVIRDLQLIKQRQAKNYFITGLVLFTVLAFFVYRTYSTRQKLKLLTLRNKIASDLHDDVGSTLSSISIFSQMALEESKEVRPLLQTIGDSSRKMLDAMADIVWTINPENDQFEKIIMRMRSFAYELLGAKQIEFRFVADKNISSIKLPMEARRNLYLIFKEATNNMVKYAGASKAMFSIKEEQGKLMMMIKDNGKGFESNKATTGNGLKNMKKRAGEMGAILQIDSMPGSGTTIQLELAV